MKGDKMSELEILHQDGGRFDRRFSVGPACWPHFDLLWIHEGAISLKLGAESVELELRAPMGVLIFPNVPFQGITQGAFAAASVCHFKGAAFDGQEVPSQYILSDRRDAYHIENLIRLSLDYKDRETNMDVRTRLLRSILDCFGETWQQTDDAGRLGQAWSYTGSRLADIRSLTDVAASIGLSESALRNLHRQQYPTSAGRHLQEMRFLKAEQLLSTTGLSIREISTAVGYAHVESFSAAFTGSRGRTPGAYRRWCKRLA
jgi:AraC-like DNA-binding protein